VKDDAGEAVVDILSSLRAGTSNIDDDFFIAFHYQVDRAT